METQLQDHLSAPSNVESRFSSNTILNLSSFSVKELIDFHEKRLRRQTYYGILALGIFTLICLVLLLVSFVLPKCETNNHSCSKNRSILMILGGSFSGMGLLMIILVFFISNYMLNNQLSDVNSNNEGEQVIVWRLNDLEWIRYLNYIHGPERQWTEMNPASSFCCRQSSYNRLSDRQYGHLVFYGNGLIIDQLHFVSFRRFSLVKMELLTIGQGQEQILGLRVHTYLKDGNNSRTYYFDLFAPSSVSVEEIQRIIQMYNSRVRGFDGFDMTMTGLHLATSIAHSLT